MTSSYEHHKEITKEILDSVQVGDLVKCNDWKKPLRVKGVSENYFVMARKAFGETLYSICEKNPWGGTRYNAMCGGMFHIGTDNMIFGWFGWNEGRAYDFDDSEAVGRYLQALESGEIEVSVRRAVPLYEIAIKKERKHETA